MPSGVHGGLRSEWVILADALGCLMLAFAADQDACAEALSLGSVSLLLNILRESLKEFVRSCAPQPSSPVAAPRSLSASQRGGSSAFPLHATSRTSFASAGTLRQSPSLASARDSPPPTARSIASTASRATTVAQGDISEQRVPIMRALRRAAGCIMFLAREGMSL